MSYSMNDQPSQPVRSEPVRVALRMPAQTSAVTFGLMGFTILVYLGQMLSQQLLGVDVLAAMGMKANSYIIQGQYYRLITPMFLHGSLAHIGFNMYGLYIVGRGLEKAYGHWRFFLLYMLAGFAGNTLSFLFSPAPSLGASTAIFGLFAAQGVYFYQNRRIYGGQATSVLGNIGVLIVINLAYGFAPGTNIDNFGHLGGLLGGAVYALLAGPVFAIEGYPPDVRLEDKRGEVLPWLVAAVEAAGIALLAATKIFANR
jgi:rhomboid protease GluP